MHFVQCIKPCKTELLLQRKEIKESLSKQDVTTVENNIKTNNNELLNKRATFKNLKDEYSELKNVSFDIDSYNQKKKEILELEKNQSELKVEINHLKEANKKIESLIEKKVCPTCNHPIEVAEQNSFIDDNKKEIDKKQVSKKYRRLKNYAYLSSFIIFLQALILFTK